MLFRDILASEWRPALGCTEPAAIAFGAASAACLAAGPVEEVRLVCDPRIYKNCHAVGVPRSGHKSGIHWALSIGAHLSDPSAGLTCFEGTTPAILAAAEALLAKGGVSVEIDPREIGLLIDCRVRRGGHDCRAVIRGEHTRLELLERDGRAAPSAVPIASATRAPPAPSFRERLAAMSLLEFVEMARGMSDEDRRLLRQRVALKLGICWPSGARSRLLRRNVSTRLWPWLAW